MLERTRATPKGVHGDAEIAHRAVKVQLRPQSIELDVPMNDPTVIHELLEERLRFVTPPVADGLARTRDSNKPKQPTFD